MPLRGRWRAASARPAPAWRSDNTSPTPRPARRRRPPSAPHPYNSPTQGAKWHYRRNGVRAFSACVASGPWLCRCVVGQHRLVRAVCGLEKPKGGQELRAWGARRRGRRAAGGERRRAGGAGAGCCRRRRCARARKARPRGAPARPPARRLQGADGRALCVCVGHLWVSADRAGRAATSVRAGLNRIRGSQRAAAAARRGVRCRGPRRGRQCSSGPAGGAGPSSAAQTECRPGMGGFNSFGWERPGKVTAGPCGGRRRGGGAEGCQGLRARRRRAGRAPAGGARATGPGPSIE
jgi:hypothetical protein